MLLLTTRAKYWTVINMTATLILSKQNLISGSRLMNVDLPYFSGVQNHNDGHI